MSPEEREAERKQRAEQDRRQEFYDAEGSGEDLGEVLLKLGRRLFSHQAQLAGLWKDYREDIRHQALLRSFGNDEERVALMTERLDTVRTRTREHVSKAVALGLDGLVSSLEVHRGFASACFERLRSIVGPRLDPAFAPAARGPGAGVGDDQDAIRKLVLRELIKDLLHDEEPLIDKLTLEQRRQLLDYARGRAAAPPDVLAPFFDDPALARPAGTPETPFEPQKRIKNIWLGTIPGSSTRPRPPAHGAPPPEPNLDVAGPGDGAVQDMHIESNVLEDQDLVVYVGACIFVGAAKDPLKLGRDALAQLKDDDERADKERADVRLVPAPLRVTFVHPNDQELHASDGEGAFDVRRLPGLGKVTLRFRLLRHEWFHAHWYWRGHHPGEALQYEATVSVPAVNAVFAVSFMVTW